MAKSGLYSIKMDDVDFVLKTGRNFKISWKMTDLCNYRCPYCYMASTVAKCKHTPLQKVLEIASHIDEMLAKHPSTSDGKKHVLLHLIGGEVSIYPLIEVLEQIKTRQLTGIIVATNFSRPLEYWQELDKYCKGRGIKLNIIASFHLTECDHNEFVEKAIAMNARVKCVVNSSNIAVYRPLFDRLRAAGNIIECTVQRGSENSCEILQGENLEYINQMNVEMNARKRSPYFMVWTKDGECHKMGTNIEFINSLDVGGYDPEGFVCTMGLDGIRIAEDGSLRRAGCRWASITQNRLGDLCGEYEIPKDPVICHTTAAGKDGIPIHKMCTCFGNASMWRPRALKTNEYAKEKASHYTKPIELGKGKVIVDDITNAQGYVEEKCL